MNILLVEPDRLLATNYQTALQAQGHVVRVSHSAQAAVHQLDEACPELIILEIQMANHNGVEFLYELRSYPEWQAVPVLIHSFVPQRQLPPQVRLLELGAATYLYKPTTSLRRLTAAINRYLPIPA